MTDLSFSVYQCKLEAVSDRVFFIILFNDTSKIKNVVGRLKLYEDSADITSPVLMKKKL